MRNEVGLVVVLLNLSVVGCDSKEEGFDVPGNTTSGTDTGSPDTCPLEWTWDGDVLVDPNTCLAWSSVSEPMDWYSAVSPEESANGGCGTDCDDDGSGYCADMAPLGGTSAWSLPDADTLEEFTLNGPPVEDAQGDLWSSTTDTHVNSLAVTADLSQPGMTVNLGKSSEALVRCVASY